MKVYQQGRREGVFTHTVCPGNHVPGECPPEWFGEDGVAIEFQVRFENGCAKVPDNLGRYLIKHQMAYRSALILPSLLAA
jgi:hypothetical protein